MLAVTAAFGIGFIASNVILGIVVILNLINLNICQPRMLLKNLANLGANAANLSLVKSTQMECPNDPSSATAAIRLRQGYGMTGQGRADGNRSGPQPFAAAQG
jgi:hypothetical protein